MSTISGSGTACLHPVIKYEFPNLRTTHAPSIRDATNQLINQLTNKKINRKIRSNTVEVLNQLAPLDQSTPYTAEQALKHPGDCMVAVSTYDDDMMFPQQTYLLIGEKAVTQLRKALRETENRYVKAWLPINKSQQKSIEIVQNKAGIISMQLAKPAN